MSHQPRTNSTIFTSKYILRVPSFKYFPDQKQGHNSLLVELLASTFPYLQYIHNTKILVKIYILMSFKCLNLFDVFILPLRRLSFSTLSVKSLRGQPCLLLQSQNFPISPCLLYLDFCCFWVFTFVSSFFNALSSTFTDGLSSAFACLHNAY